jgi:hypothetical protein
MFKPTPYFLHISSYFVDQYGNCRKQPTPELKPISSRRIIMEKTYGKSIYLIALFLAVAVGTASARQNNQPSPSPADQLTTTEIGDLVYMREEEKLARDSYLVLGEKWGLSIFTNISKSEQRHMDALGLLIEQFGITDPILDETDVGTFADPTLQILFDDLMVQGLQSDIEGLKVGGVVEETDILDLQHTIEHTDNVDLIATYENLICGSRNHLRAFVRQIEFYGEIYTPVLMSQDELNAIVDFPTERGCGTSRKDKGKNNQGKGKKNQDKGSNCG